jgi:hypothetical protein
LENELSKPAWTRGLSKGKNGSKPDGIEFWMPGNVLIPELKLTWFLPVEVLLPVAAGVVFVVTVLVTFFVVTFFVATFFVVGVTVLVLTIPLGETVLVTTVPFGETVLVTTVPFGETFLVKTFPFGETVLVATVPADLVRGVTVFMPGLTNVGLTDVG